MLNDFCRIHTQSRNSGPESYLYPLLGFGLDKTQECITAEYSSDRPSATTLSFSYVTPKETIDYTISAIPDIAEVGWRILPSYHMDRTSGKYWHEKPKSTELYQWHCGGLNYRGDGDSYASDLCPDSASTFESEFETDHDRLLRGAYCYMKSFKHTNVRKDEEAGEEDCTEEHNSQQWIVSRREVYMLLKDPKSRNRVRFSSSAFDPAKYQDETRKEIEQLYLKQMA